MRASAAESFLKLLGENLDIIAGPVVTLVYPLYASIKAIETRSSVDDQQWLTYWVLYSMITLFELTFAKLIEWLPFWSYAKLMFTCWLVIPYFSGAGHVYKNFVRPYLVTRQKSVNIWHVPYKDVFSQPDDIITAAEKYMEQNGTEAFEKMIQRNNRVTTPSAYDYNKFTTQTNRETTSSPNDHTNNYAFYDDNYRYEDEHRY